jgi:hypothetical protein
MKLIQSLVAVLLVALAMSVSAKAACSNATIKGGYGFLLTGTNATSLAAVVGQFTADGNGGLTGSETVSNNGVISSSVPLTGSYSINSSCAGNARLSASGLSAAKYSLTVVSAGKQIEMVDADTGITQFGYALAQASSVCTAAAIKGIFGFQGGGFNSSLIPSAFAGQVKLDGAGNLTGNETLSSGGTIISGPVSGTYAVNPDCTGSVSITFNGSDSHDNFVIVSGDQSALEIQTDSGKIVTTTAVKQ